MVKTDSSEDGGFGGATGPVVSFTTADGEFVKHLHVPVHVHVYTCTCV